MAAQSGVAEKTRARKRVPTELADSRKTAKTIREGTAKNPSRFYKEVGLVADPNKSIRKKKPQKNTLKSKPASEFVKKLEAKANKPQKKRFKFGKVMSEELDYYIKTYGDDFERMARDRRNIYQESPGQLRYKVIKYKKIHLGE